MKRNLTKLFTHLFLLLVGFMVITSCGKRKSIKKVEELTKKFYALTHEEHLDSLELLYPTIDLDLFKFIYADDEIEIREVKSLDDNKFKVVIVSPGSGIELYPSFFFEKNDSSYYGFYITDSKGLVDPAYLPSYMVACGSVKEYKEYTDMEYVERYKISNEIYYNRAKDIADYVVQNVRIFNNTTNLSSNWVDFTLENNSNVDCLGFTVYFNLAEFFHNTDLGEISGFYGREQARLEAGRSQRYRMDFNPKELKAESIWRTVKNGRFEITPQAIINYNRDYLHCLSCF